MNFTGAVRRVREESGQALVEFSLSAFLLGMLLFGVVDVGRMVLVYTTISNAARVGNRYAIVHGSDNLASITQIQNVVKNFLSAGPMNTSIPSLNIGVNYPDPVGSATSGCTSPGCHVSVTVSYPYNPLTSYFPLSVTLQSTSQGVITF